jgi:hypothetical protein
MHHQLSAYHKLPSHKNIIRGKKQSFKLIQQAVHQYGKQHKLKINCQGRYPRGEILVG